MPNLRPPLRTTVVGTLLQLAVVVLGPGTRSARAQERVPGSRPSATVRDFAWLTGAWEGRPASGGGAIHVVYDAPHAGTLTGVMHLVGDDGRVLVVELIALTDEPGGVALRFRHFSPALAAYESDYRQAMRLVSHSGDEDVFRNEVPYEKGLMSTQPRTTTLRRRPDGSFTGRSEIIGEDGRTSVIEATYRRMTATGDGRTGPAADGACGESSGPERAGEVIVSCFTMADGRRALRHSGVVDAPPDSVWSVFTTSEGLRSFVAPRAWLDFEIGGTWEASYDRNAAPGDSTNIVNEILSYLPDRMLSIRVRRAPSGFPYPEAVEQVWTVIEMKPLDQGHTWVTVSMLGYRTGQPWDALYGFFEHGNTVVLRNLQQRFRTGPVDWTKSEGARPEGGR